MEPDEALLQDLDEAYAVFSIYEAPKLLHAAPTRDAAKILRTLTSAPLRDLDSEQIGPYAGWAMTTVGTVMDYKHFLPRILEQAVREPVWMGTEPPIIAERLKRADWRTWPTAEQEAIVAVFRAAFALASDRHPDQGADAADWFCGLAALDQDVGPLMSAWPSRGSGSAILQLALVVTDAAGLIANSPDDFVYWTYVDERTRHAIGDWLRSIPVYKALQDHIDNIDVEDRWTIQSALDVLDRAAARVTLQ